jgi:hypothetical protein
VRALNSTGPPPPSLSRYSEAQADFSEVPELGDGQTAEEAQALASRVRTLLGQWETLVHLNGWERSRNQLERIKEGLGLMPAADAGGSKLALWAAALINPLPALGVAPEVRPDVLGAPTGYQRLLVVERGLEESIKHVSRARGTVSIGGLAVKVHYIGALLVVAFLAYSASGSDRLREAVGLAGGLLANVTNSSSSSAGRVPVPGSVTAAEL